MSLIERLRDRGVLPQPCAYHDKAMLEAATQLQAYEAEIERLRAAISWLEPPFVTQQTSKQEIHKRIDLMLADAKRASLDNKRDR